MSVQAKTNPRVNILLRTTRKRPPAQRQAPPMRLAGRTAMAHVLMDLAWNDPIADRALSVQTRRQPIAERGQDEPIAPVH